MPLLLYSKQSSLYLCLHYLLLMLNVNIEVVLLKLENDSRGLLFMSLEDYL